MGPREQPTQKQMVEKYRHVLGGLIADAYTTRAVGDALSERMRIAFRKVDEIIASIYADLLPPAPLPVKEAAQPQGARNGEVNGRTPAAGSGANGHAGQRP